MVFQGVHDSHLQTFDFLGLFKTVSDCENIGYVIKNVLKIHIYMHNASFILTIYFENVRFLPWKRDLDARPRANNLSLVILKNSISTTIDHPWVLVNWSKFLVTGCSFGINQLRIREEALESGNQFSGWRISASIPSNSIFLSHPKLSTSYSPKSNMKVYTKKIFNENKKFNRKG